MKKAITTMLIIIALSIIFFSTMCDLKPSDGSPANSKDKQSLAIIIDNYVNSFPSHQQFSGVILVADGNSILFYQAYGLANHEFNIPNILETRYQIGSIAKAFTAMLVLKLVEQNKLDLDRTIIDYLPYYPEQPGRLITLKHLLSNTSGIPHHHQFIPEYFSQHDHYFHTPKQLIRLFWDAPLKHDPGDRISYSSPGYYILGAILQQTTKKSYAELLQEYIFTPLPMNNTLVENNKSTDKNLATGYIRGISGFIRAYSEDKSTALAAGDIMSTAYDLYLWQKSLNTNGDRILSSASKEIMFQSVLPGSPMTMVGPHYKIPYDNGKKILAVSLINGSSSGYVSYIGRQTEYNRGVIVLSNVNGDDVARIADDIGDIFLRQYLGIAIGEQASLTRTPPPAAKIPKSDLIKFLGYYL